MASSDRVRAPFDRAMALPAGGREAFVRGEAGDDEGLIAEVLGLLEHAGEGTTETGPLPEGGRSGLPGRIGHYKILGILGEGGFGVVYEAEQTEPVKRRVALKVIKAGMDSKAVVARFEAERQALAVMDHPCVAKVFDGGATEAVQGGRPYFVMELVRGEPITSFCDRERLTIDERCELFIRVCDAVQHSHTKGVIHRDLKPSNVLVSYDAEGHAQPKVIDFGVAKALNQRLTEKTVFTELGQLIGTPGYMSPEQAEMSGLDIDTRSDVYSLGVLLYELLTGVLPFDSRSLREAGFGEIQRIIREQAPPKPSTRLSTEASGDTEAVQRIVKARRSDIRSIAGKLRRDLDWVVLKCLEKERERRYETAKSMGEELRRYLDGGTVVAGPPSVMRRLRARARALTAWRAITIGIMGMGAVVPAFAVQYWMREGDLELYGQAADMAAVFSFVYGSAAVFVLCLLFLGLLVLAPKRTGSLIAFACFALIIGRVSYSTYINPKLTENLIEHSPEMRIAIAWDALIYADGYSVRTRELILDQVDSDPVQWNGSPPSWWFAFKSLKELRAGRPTEANVWHARCVDEYGDDASRIPALFAIEALIHGLGQDTSAASEAVDQAVWLISSVEAEDDPLAFARALVWEAGLRRATPKSYWRYGNLQVVADQLFATEASNSVPD